MTPKQSAALLHTLMQLPKEGSDLRLDIRMDLPFTGYKLLSRLFEDPESGVDFKNSELPFFESLADAPSQAEAARILETQIALDKQALAALGKHEAEQGLLLFMHFFYTDGYCNGLILDLPRWQSEAKDSGQRFTMPCISIDEGFTQRKLKDAECIRVDFFIESIADGSRLGLPEVEARFDKARAGFPAQAKAQQAANAQEQQRERIEKNKETIFKSLNGMSLDEQEELLKKIQSMAP